MSTLLPGFSRGSMTGALCVGVNLAMAMAICAPAQAQDVRRLEQALDRAMGHYDMLELDKAERELESAIAQAERFRLTNESITASLYIFLGVVRQPSQGEAAARDAFRKAMLIDPNVDIPPDYRTPSLESLLAEVRAEVTGGGGGGGGGYDPRDDYVPTGRSIEHTPIETAASGQALYFEAFVPPDLPLYRVVLKFRRFGERQYATAEMNPRGRTRFETTLDGELVCSSQIDYFIEVLDRKDEVLVATGGPSSPLNVFVFGSESGCQDIAIDDAPPTGDGDGDRQWVFLDVMVGTGFGLATGTPLANPNININPGLAPAPVHLLAELGVIITPSVHLSAFYRNQFVLLETGVEVEPMFGGKLRWWFDNEGDLRIHTSFGAGFGFVRHTVDLRPAAEFTDTAQHGPLHAGLGFGFAAPLGANFALVADAYIPILFPALSVHVDATAGFRVSF